MVYKIHQFYLSFKWVYYLNMSKESADNSFYTHWDLTQSGYRERIQPKEINLFQTDIIKATYCPGGEWEDGTDSGTLPSILLFETADSRTFELYEPQINLPGSWREDVTEMFKDMQIESIGVVPDENLLVMRFQEKWGSKIFKIKSTTIDIYHSRRKNTQDNTQ
jgi:hypothetical protein